MLQAAAHQLLHLGAAESACVRLAASTAAAWPRIMSATSVQPPNCISSASHSNAAGLSDHTYSLSCTRSMSHMGASSLDQSSALSKLSSQWNSINMQQHQQWRSYHVGPYSVRTGQPRPEPQPQFERVRTSQPGQYRWQRTVLRFPPDIQVTCEDGALQLAGKAGSVRLELSQLDPTGLVAYKLVQPAAGAQGAPNQSAFMLLASPDIDRFNAVAEAIDSNVRGVMQGYLVGITVKGVGYRLEPFEGPLAKKTWYFEKANAPEPTTPITYPFSKPVNAIRVKVGYSRNAIFPMPPDVRAFCVKPTLVYLYGLQTERLQAVAQQIRDIKKPNAYTGNGIQLVGEVIKLKQRKSSK